MAGEVVSDKELAAVARIVSSQNMKQIAIKYLGLSEKETDTIEESIEDQWKYNFAVLNIWKDKRMKRRIKRRKKPTYKDLLSVFINAAADGLVDYTKIQESFGASIELPDRSPELKEGRLQKLCKMFTHKEELRILARKGLNIEDYVVEYHFTRNGDDLKGIAYSLLKDWMVTQENRRVAYARLTEALRNVNMAFYVKEVLDDDEQ